jgi:AcrR family transcriptional regulator
MAAAPALPRERERNAARTRELILAAAERLFAERGFEGTSLSEVGSAAGVSRATPGYFFGSKAELHRAVLERCFEEVREAVRLGRERALRSGQSREVILAGAVSDYVDFIAARPHLVKLIQREALSDRRALEGLPLGFAMGREMISALAQELELGDADQNEVAHLLFSLIALTWFPHILGSTLGRVIGLDPGRPGFQAERKNHTTELLLGWLRAREGAARPRPPTRPPEPEEPTR